MSAIVLPNTFYTADQLSEIQISLSKELKVDLNSTESISSQASSKYGAGSNGLTTARILQHNLENIDVPKNERYVDNEEDYEVCIWDQSNYDSIEEAISSGANYESRTSIPLSSSEDIVSLLMLLESCIRFESNTQIAVKTVSGKWLPMDIILTKD